MDKLEKCYENFLIYFSFDKNIPLNGESHISFRNLLEEFNKINSSKLEYEFKYIDAQNGEIRPKIVWGGYKNVHLKITLEKNIISVKAKISSSIKIIIGSCISMLLGFLYQSTKEQIPFWIFPLILLAPFYFQMFLKWQQNELYEYFKRDLEKFGLTSSEKRNKY